MKLPIVSGFSLVELMFSGALFCVFSWGMMMVLLDGLDINRQGEEMMVATAYATEALEALRSIRTARFDDLEEINTTGIEKRSGEWYLKGLDTQDEFGKFKRVIRIENARRDADGRISESGDAVDSETKKIIVTVSYMISAMHQDSVVLATYVTRLSSMP